MSDDRPVGKRRLVELQVSDDTVKKVMVFEVRPNDILKAIGELPNNSPDMDILKKLIPLCTTLDIDDLKELYPSDVEKVVEAFKEINSPFWRLAEMIGMAAPLRELMTGAMKNFKVQFGKALASSMVQDT